MMITLSQSVGDSPKSARVAIVLQSLCSPNEDFGNPKNILDRLFGHFFKGVSTRFGRLLLENVLKTMVQNAFRVSKIVWGA
jgi:hypothetical protein